jgi:hypothetical protein
MLIKKNVYSTVYIKITRFVNKIRWMRKQPLKTKKGRGVERATGKLSGMSDTNI